MLADEIKSQVHELLAPLEAHYTLAIKANTHNEHYAELIEFLSDVAECSEKVVCTVEEGDQIEFSILKRDKPTGITFRAIPSGHEFSSLLLALLNADGKGRNLLDAPTVKRVEVLRGEINLITYMSLSCTNCPDVVQALNLMALYSEKITHTIVDGALCEDEIERLGVLSVPTVYADGESLFVGRGGVSDLLEKLEEKYGSVEREHRGVQHYDLVVAGGGPAGVAAAIYSVRKGLRVALVAKRLGGQVNETTTIENIPSIAKTTGSELTEALRTHSEEYEIETLENRTIERFEVEGLIKILRLKGGETLTANQLIIATGATWRRLNIEGESQYIGRGVAFCPHCDGPLFKAKNVAVIGGGNSGVEAAIDLSAVCNRVTLLEYLIDMKADKVLQDKLRSLPNVDIHTNVEVTNIQGDGERVTSLRYINRGSTDGYTLEVDGIFVQIGLAANSSLFAEHLDTNTRGEIEVDARSHTSLSGVYATGDVTTVPYKQIVVAMGEGAKAALSAFDDRVRGV